MPVGEVVEPADYWDPPDPPAYGAAGQEDPSADAQPAVQEGRPIFEDDEFYEEYERPRYSWCEATRPKPVTMKGRRGTDVPRDFNPLLDWREGLPPFAEVRPQHLVSGMQMTVDQFGKDLERYQISMNVSAARPWRLTWEKFAEPLEHMLDRVDRIWTTIRLFREVNDTSVELQRAYHDMMLLLTGVSTILAQSDDIYEVMRLFTHNPKLTEAQRRIVDKYMLQSWHAGIGVQDARASREFNRIFTELSYLADLFSVNLATDEDQAVRLATSEEEVAGLSPSIRDSAAAAARASGRTGASAELGPWLLKLGPSERRAVLETSENRELRRETYLAVTRLAWRNTTGAVEGDNAWIVDRMLELRHYWARNTSYESYADMVFTNRMASERQVDVFLRSLQNASLPAAKAELEELQAFARESGESEELMPWDVAFWRERLRRERFGAAEDDLQPYLALPTVLSGLFGLLRRLFDIDVTAADGQAPLWDESVRFFRVVDGKTRIPLGGIYLDAHSAPRKRRPGFWAEPSLGYSRLLGTHGESRRPVVHLVGDVEPPAEEGQPALLTWQQVLGLFRATGHALQELLTDQQEGLVAGRKLMELDAVGLPPRLLELWAYDPTTLRSLGQHHVTGEPVPEAMVDALLASRAFHSGSRLLDEVRLARLDLELHARFDPQGGETAWEAARRVEEELAIMPSAVEEHRLCRFSEPFATGHAAGYYADLWAQVLAADAFEAFQEAGIEDEQAVRRLGELFRASILGPGGGRSPLAAFRDFRGRIPRVAALLRRFGLSRSSSQAGTGGPAEAGGAA